MKFEFKKVTEDTELLTEIHRLRYKTYCEEWKFERPEDHPGGLEIDEFDKYSIHFAGIADGAVIGTVRIIFDSKMGFPIEEHCKITVDLSHIQREKTGEISRLAVSKEYRRRMEDRFLFEDDLESFSEKPKIQMERRKRQEIVMGLYKCIYIESKKRGLTHWFAVMTKGLYLLLKRMGILFLHIGPEVNYHGLRTPYLGSIEYMETEFSRINPDLFKEFQDSLKSPF